MKIFINWASITNYFVDFSVISFPLKLTENRIYTAPAAQRLRFVLNRKLQNWSYLIYYTSINKYA